MPPVPHRYLIEGKGNRSRRANRGGLGLADHPSQSSVFRSSLRRRVRAGGPKTHTRRPGEEIGGWHILATLSASMCALSRSSQLAEQYTALAPERFAGFWKNGSRPVLDYTSPFLRPYTPPRDWWAIFFHASGRIEDNSAGLRDNPNPRPAHTDPFPTPKRRGQGAGLISWG